VASLFLVLTQHIILGIVLLEAENMAVAAAVIHCG